MATVSQITADPALETRLFWDQYKTTIIAVAAVLFLGGLGYAGYELYTARRAATRARSWPVRNRRRIIST